MLACRPMLSFAAAVMAGIVAARRFPGLAEWLVPGWIGFACLAIAHLLRSAKPHSPPDDLPAEYVEHVLPVPGFLAARGLNRLIVICCIGFFLAGATRQSWWERELRADRLPESGWFDATLLAMAPSREHAGESGRWRIPALLLTADGREAATPVRLSGSGGPDFRRGDIIRSRVVRHAEHPKAHPGAFDARLWLEREGLAASLTAARRRGADKDAPIHEVVPVDNPPAFTRLRRVIDSVRHDAVTRTLSLGGDSGGVLAAMLYGYRKEIDDGLRNAFRRVGIGHVLAISGLHVGLIVGLLWWVSGWMGWGARCRALACLVLSLAYLGLAGGQVAASRATLMAVIHLGGIAWGRRGDMLNSLGAAAFVLCLKNPSAPLDVSFQLSFTAVIFIYLALRRRPDREQNRRPPVPAAGWLFRLRREAGSLTRLSVSTWLGLFPIIALVFNQVNLVGLPINIAVIPLMSLVLAGGLLLPWFGWLPGAAWFLCLPERLLAHIARLADALPGSSFPCHPPCMPWIGLFYASVFLILLRGIMPTARLRNRWLLGTGVAAALAFLGVVADMAPHPPPPGGRITLLPGRGFGVIVAEAPEGGIGIVGTLSRGGIAPAEWLHRLHRSGKAGVAAVGGGAPANLDALDYHYPVAAETFLRTVDMDDADHGVWRELPGAPGVFLTASRDSRGRLVWVAIRAGKRTFCVAPRLAGRQLAWRLEHKTAGSDAQAFCLGFVERAWSFPVEPSPAGAVALIGRAPPGMPAGWFERGRYGAIVLDDGLAGFDGAEWRELSAR